MTMFERRRRQIPEKSAVLDSKLRETSANVIHIKSCKFCKKKKQNKKQTNCNGRAVYVCIRPISMLLARMKGSLCSRRELHRKRGTNPHSA